MSKSIEELELKFSNFNTKIENKVNLVKNTYSEQQGLLKERFDVDRLSNKYSNEFNDLRKKLLELISTNLRSEVNHVNEFVSDKNNNVQTNIEKLEKARNLNFNKCIIRSEEMCICRLILKEFRFGCQFSEPQLIKYKDILGISDYLVQQDNVWDMDQSLILASQNSNSDMVRLILDAGANADAKDKCDDKDWIRLGYGNKGTALIFSSRNGHLDTVKHLVENGADVMAMDDDNCTALIFASINGNLEIVKYLVENGADVNAIQSSGWTALMFAAYSGHFEIVKYFFEHVAEFKNKNFQLVAYASFSNHLEMVKYLVKRGDDLNAANKWNDTGLIEACLNGNFEIVKHLVENGADVNAKERLINRTALIRASEKGHFEIVKYLVENGAYVNSKDKYNATALIYASKNGHLEIVKYLVENGADVNAKNIYSKTALIYASEKGHLEIVKYLAEHGADVNSKDLSD